MKLSARISFATVAGFGCLIAALQTAQFTGTRRIVTDLGAATLRNQREREFETAGNINTALQFGITRFLETGDMDVFDKVIEVEKKMPGFKEFSLYDDRGIITYSSDKSALKRELAPSLKEKLYGGPANLIEDEAGFLNVYQSQLVTKGCLECHESWKVGAVCGVTQLRFSTEALSRTAAQATAGVQAATWASLRYSLGTLAALLAGSAALAWWIHRRVARPLQVLGADLLKGSRDTSSTADQIATVSQRVAAGAREQASGVSEAGSSLEQMLAMTRTNAEHAATARDRAAHARRAAEAGTADLASMTTAMNEIKAASDNIAKILKTIDEIAFQTNILALNASVEAARAGEAGQGFGVVADEVRSLAQRCAQAARDTASQIEDAIEKSRRGMSISGKVEQTLAEIVTRVKDVDSAVAGIARACAAQTEGIARIHKAVAGVGEIAANSAADSVQTARASAELEAEAAELRTSVDGLMSLLDGRPNPTDPIRISRDPDTITIPAPPRSGTDSPHRSPSRRAKSEAGTLVATEDSP